MAYTERSLFIENGNSLVNVEAAGIAALNAVTGSIEHISASIQTRGMLFSTAISTDLLSSRGSATGLIFIVPRGTSTFT